MKVYGKLLSTDNDHYNIQLTEDGRSILIEIVSTGETIEPCVDDWEVIKDVADCLIKENK